MRTETHTHMAHDGNANVEAYVFERNVAYGLVEWEVREETG